MLVINDGLLKHRNFAAMSSSWSVVSKILEGGGDGIRIFGLSSATRPFPDGDQEAAIASW